MPSLTVKAFAEFLDLPAWDQQKKLYEQKYPRQSPQIYKQPYYSHSLSAIKNYYRSGNKMEVINDALTKCNELKPAVKITHNIRVLNSFINSKQKNRKITINTSKRHSLKIGDVEIRLTFDLVANSIKDKKYIFYNVNNAPATSDLARYMVEIAQYVAKSTNQDITTKDIEYIDLYNDTTFTFSSVRSSTIKKVTQNIKIIEALWNTI